MYLDTAVDSMLKGLGEQIYTMRVNVIDALSSVIAVVLLVPRMGIMGYVAVILISELINFSFSLHRLKKVTRVELGIFKKLPKLILCVIGAVSVSKLIGIFNLSLKLKTMLMIASSILIYVIFLAVFGLIPIPRGYFGRVIKPILTKYTLKKDKEIKNESDRYNSSDAAKNLRAAVKNRA